MAKKAFLTLISSIDSPESFRYTADILKLTPYMTSFDDNFIAEQKIKLQDRQVELLKELNIDAIPNPNASGDFEARFPDYGDKEDDSAAEVATFENNLSLEKELEVSLFNVKKALRKIEEGTYGLCEKCGQPIEEARLQAFPSATSCMDCKRKGL